MEAGEGFVCGWAQRTLGLRCAGRGQGVNQGPEDQPGRRSWSGRGGEAWWGTGVGAAVTEGPGGRVQGQGPGTSSKRAGGCGSPGPDPLRLRGGWVGVRGSGGESST